MPQKLLDTNKNMSQDANKMRKAQRLHFIWTYLQIKTFKEAPAGLRCTKKLLKIVVTGMPFT